MFTMFRRIRKDNYGCSGSDLLNNLTTIQAMGCVEAPVPFRDIMDVAVPVPTVRKPVKEAHWALTVQLFGRNNELKLQVWLLLNCEVLTIPDGVEHDEWIQTAETTEEGCSTRC